MGFQKKSLVRYLKKKEKNYNIGTKFSPINSSYNNVIESLERSLKRLKTDFGEINKIHWPNPSIFLIETMEALAKLIKVLKQLGIHH